MLTVAREPAGKEHLICVGSGERFLGKRFLGVKRGEVGLGLSLGMSSKHMSGTGKCLWSRGSLVKEQRPIHRPAHSCSYHTSGRAGDVPLAKGRRMWAGI